jgi:glycosyltransferase involved in cell wall biosynthesis
MKIVHVLSALTKGGGERVVAELANVALQNGDEVTIIAGWPVDPIYLQNDINAGVNIKFVSATKKLSYFNILPFIIKNKKWLTIQDVLHCHLTYGSVFGSIVNIFLKKILFKKSPAIFETNHAVGMPVPKFNRWFSSRMLLLRNGVIFMAKDTYWDNFITRYPELKTAVIPNGISVLQPLKTGNAKEVFCNDMNIPDTCKYIVGTVGMLRPDRKPELYIPIFKAVKEALGTEVHFVMAGGGSEFDKIKQLTAEAGIGELVHMPGIINNPAAFIVNMDVYVSVSVGETVGISMIEAAMCNIPVVGIQLSKNYQAKETDWVWAGSNASEVANKIIFLLQNMDERKKLADKQNIHAINNFTSAAMYNGYTSFYKKAMTE